MITLYRIIKLILIYNSISIKQINFNIKYLHLLMRINININIYIYTNPLLYIKWDINVYKMKRLIG